MTELDFNKMFSEAPQVLKEVTVATATSLKRLRHAEKQLKLWKDEADAARAQFDSNTFEQGKLLQRWDPMTNSLIPLEDLGP